LTADKCTSAK